MGGYHLPPNCGRLSVHICAVRSPRVSVKLAAGRYVLLLNTMLGNPIEQAVAELDARRSETMDLLRLWAIQGLPNSRRVEWQPRPGCPLGRQHRLVEIIHNPRQIHNKVLLNHQYHMTQMCLCCCAASFGHHIFY
jgi:hypothetical protein